MSGLSVDIHHGLPGFALQARFDTPPQGVTALFGRSGSGKTSVLRAVAGLLRAGEGSIRFNGETWQDGRHFLPTHRRPIGYVFQEASLFPHLSVQQNLQYGWRKVPPGEQRIDYDEAVALLGIAPLLGRDPARLSGGERQRVAIARALLTSPQLLLMDEPLSALDQAARADILPYLEQLHHELALPVLYVSHDLDEIARLADRMVLMEGGRVIASGPVSRLLTDPRLPVAGFDNAGAILEGRISAHDKGFHLTYVACSGNRIAVPLDSREVGAHTRIQIHARDVSIALSAHHDTSILNIVPAVIQALDEDGRSRWLVELVLEDGQTLLAHVTRRSRLALGLEKGMLVYAQIKAVALVR